MLRNGPFRFSRKEIVYYLIYKDSFKKFSLTKSSTFCVTSTPQLLHLFFRLGTYPSVVKHSKVGSSPTGLAFVIPVYRQWPKRSKLTHLKTKEENHELQLFLKMNLNKYLSQSSEIILHSRISAQLFQEYKNIYRLYDKFQILRISGCKAYVQKYEKNEAEDQKYQ